MEDGETENSFKKLINICKNGCKQFGDVLCNYESIDLDVIVCYLNLAMTSCATVKFKDMMTYTKLSEVVTMCEEAFAILVMESNLNRWMYLAKKEIIENKTLSSSVRQPNDEQCDESHIGSLIESLTDDSSYDSIPEVLYQNNISKGKGKKIIAGKWNQDSFDRLNVLLDKIEEKRNSTARKTFEEKLQKHYILQADVNMAQLARNKRKREMKYIENIEKKVVVQNVLNFVEI